MEPFAGFLTLVCFCLFIYLFLSFSACCCCLLRLVLSLVAAAASIVSCVCSVSVGRVCAACVCAHRECLDVSSVPSLWLSVRIWTWPGGRIASELLSRSEAPPAALPDPSVNCNAVIMTSGWWSKGLGLF